jgi:hypothetical protein
MAALGAGVLLALLLAPVASAQVVELGDQNRALVVPTCPSTVTPTMCTIILTEVTAIERTTAALKYPTAVTKSGELVAFSLGLSNLSSNRKTARNDIHLLDSNYGGVPLAAIAVLKQTGKKRLLRYKVVAESPAVHLIPYLGQVAQFPLSKPLPVTPGEVIALSVPTWAPILSINLPSSSYSYRQGRTGKCKSPSATPAAQSVGQSTEYNCNYTGTRVEYSATEVTNPSSTPNYVHANDLGR